MKKIFPLLITLSVLACNESPADRKSYKTTGSIERLDPALDSIISVTAKPEIIAEGFEWSEGPLWVESSQMLLFSDVPRDTIYKWTEAKGKEVYLTPSGYTDTIKRGGEMGSNGLLLDKEGRLVLCQCGNRQMARMIAPTDKPSPQYLTLANAYNGKRFNSPNDAVYNHAGELFFTDPPYGLEKQMEDPNKEIPFQGVYKVKTNGDVIALADSLTRPNGIGFLPGDDKLIIANSDPEKPYWYLYDIAGDSLRNGRIFYDPSEAAKTERGLPDGFKVDSKGNVYATGPGGVWIFTKEGKPIGKIKLSESASNCALSADEKTLYITNDMYVIRVKMRE